MRWIMYAMLAAMLAVAAHAQEGKSRGTVAVVPTVNASGEKWAALKEKQQDKIREWITTHLPAAGYALTPTEKVTEALQALKLDMTDEENWRRSVIRDIGEKAGADYALFTVIVHTEQKEQKRVWYVDKEGRTDVRVWLIEVKTGEALLSGKTVTGRSGGNRITIDNKGSERQIQAAANAVRDALRDFLSPYRAK